MVTMVRGKGQEEGFYVISTHRDAYVYTHMYTDWLAGWLFRSRTRAAVVFNSHTHTHIHTEGGSDAVASHSHTGLHTHR